MWDIHRSTCYVQIYLCTLQFTYSCMCGGVGTASQSMTDSVSVVCQNLQSYFLMYCVLVMIENCRFFSVVLAAEVEAGLKLLQCSSDAIRQVYTDTDPEYDCF